MLKIYPMNVNKINRVQQSTYRRETRAKKIAHFIYKIYYPNCYVYSYVLSKRIELIFIWGSDCRFRAYFAFKIVNTDEYT